MGRVYSESAGQSVMLKNSGPSAAFSAVQTGAGAGGIVGASCTPGHGSVSIFAVPVPAWHMLWLDRKSPCWGVSLSHQTADQQQAETNAVSV